MTQNVSDFEAAIERLCSGSEEAAWEFIETYGPHIQRVVRRRLHQNLRSKFDSIDFVQMVWASFFTDPQRIARFKRPDDIVRYLVTMAKNKVVEESRRRFKFQKHNVSKERPLEQPEITESSERRRDTPSQIAIARERWREIMHRQTARDRRILELRMTGATYNEIGETLGINERTARQVVQKLAVANAE